MKRISILLLIIVAVLSQFQLKATIPVDLNNFTSLKVVGQIEIELISSEKNSIEVNVKKGSPDDLTYTIDEDGQLKIAFQSKSKSFFANQKAKVVLYYQSINEIKAIAGAKVKATKVITSDKLTLLCSGGAFMELFLKVNNLEASSSAGSKIILSGDAHTQIVKATSGSIYNANNLYSNQAIVKSLSGSIVNVWCVEEIEGQSNSGGKLSFKGNPKKRNLTGPEYRRAESKQ